MLFESVFEDVEAKTGVEVFEETTPHVVSLVDDNGIFVTQFAEIGKGGAEHRVGAHIVETTCLIILLETCLYR